MLPLLFLLLPLIAAQGISSGSSATPTSFSSVSLSSSTSASVPSASASGITIPFEDQLPCGCPDGEINYPQCREEIAPPGQEECTAESDCGPYTEKLPPGSGFGLTSEDTKRPPKPDPSTMTDLQLEVYHTMEIEFLAEFLKHDPLYGDKPLDLPFCGLGDWASIGPFEKRGRLSKRGDWDALMKGTKSPGDVVFGSKGRPQRPYCVPKRITVPVHFNIFTTNCTSQNNVSDSSIDALIGELNGAYDLLGVTYTKGQVNRYIGGGDIRRFTQNVNSETDFWNADFMMRKEYRRGGADQMHVFIVESITDAVTGDQNTNGYCFYPGQKYDACVIKFDTIPGVSFQQPGTNSTKTLIHEAGHWFGLEHTHDDDNEAECTGTDDVADTFQHPFSERFNEQQSICENGKKTTKTETVRNWMSYVTDKRDRFTPGQRAKMFTEYYTRRIGIDRPLSCTNVKLNYPAKRTTYTTWQRLQMYRALPAVKKRSILGQRPNIYNELLAICQTPYSPTEDLAAVIPDIKTDIRVGVDTESLVRPVVKVPGSGTNPPGTDPGTGNPPTGNPGTGNPPSGSPGTGNPPSGNPDTGNPPTGNPGTGNPPSGNPPIGNPPTDNPPTNNPPSGNPPTGNPPTGNPPTGNPPGTGEPGDDFGREIYHKTAQGTMCLDVKYDWRYDGSPVQLFECNGTPAQKWVIKKGQTSVRLAGTDYCLDAGTYPADFTWMKIWKCYDIPAQRWYFTEDNRIAVLDKGQCLDLRDGIFQNWAVVQTHLCTDYNTNQVWTV